MPTLVIGKNAGMKSKPKQMLGFTLLELLLVLVISAIMVTAGVQLIGGRTAHDRITEQAHLIRRQLDFLCEKAVFENRPFAMEFNNNRHQVLSYRKQKWMPLGDHAWPHKALDEAVEWALFVQGKKLSLSDQFKDLPQLICYPSGQLSAFAIRISDRFDAQQQAFQLKTDSPTELSAGWLNE